MFTIWFLTCHSNPIIETEFDWSLTNNCEFLVAWECYICIVTIVIWRICNRNKLFYLLFHVSMSFWFIASQKKLMTYYLWLKFAILRNETREIIKLIATINFNVFENVIDISVVLIYYHRYNVLTSFYFKHYILQLQFVNFST